MSGAGLITAHGATGPTDRTLEVAGSPAHFIESGAGPTVFFVHDFLETAVGFGPLAAHLGPRYRCVRVDLPGFGSTPAPDAFDHSLDAYALFLQAALRESSARDATLVLHGFGVLVGLRALSDPAGEAVRRVSRLVLLNGPLYHAPRKGLALFRRKDPLDHLEAAPPFDLLTFRRRLLSRFGNPTYFDEGYVEDLFQSWRPQGPATVRALSHRTEEFQQALPTLRKVLRTWTGPVYVLWGDDDPLQGREPALRLKREARRARVLFFPDVGYLPHAEAPEAVAKEIRKFVRVSRPPPARKSAPVISSLA